MTTALTPVGYIISWQVPSTVQLSALRDGLVKAGLDPIEFAPDLRPVSLVARSAGLIAKSMTGKDTKRMARRFEHAKRQITAEVHDPSGLTYHRDFGVEFEPLTGKVVLDNGASIGNVQQEIEDTRRAGDVTRIVQRIVEGAGSDLIPVREQGGAYFVPAGHSVIKQVRTVIEGIGGRLAQFGCTIGHGDAADQTGASVANVITDYLLKQIADLREAVAELNEKGIRSNVKSARLTRVADLKDRIAAYTDLLGTQTETLTSALNKAEAALLAKLGADDDEEPTPEVAPALVEA